MQTKSIFVPIKDKKTHVFNAKGRILGRLAVEVAIILRGKHRADYTPNADNGDYVTVTHTDEMIFSGNKLAQKKYYHHTSYPGGLKVRILNQLMKNRSDFVFKSAVKGMLPKGNLGKTMLKKLRLYRKQEESKATISVEKGK